MLRCWNEHERLVRTMFLYISTNTIISLIVEYTGVVIAIFINSWTMWTVWTMVIMLFVFIKINKINFFIEK